MAFMSSSVLTVVCVDDARNTIATRWLRALAAIGAEVDIAVGQVNLAGDGTFFFGRVQNLADDRIDNAAFAIAADNAQKTSLVLHDRSPVLLCV
jgi:hypothetical protein